jgi:2-methylcitrate dehydratase PrpD
MDMDDGHRYAALHPGTVVIPAALAAAELSGAATKELIAGIVCGYEVMIRIGMAINPSSLSRGFHSTGTVGPFGAAAAAARVLKLDREQIVAAFGMAGLQGAGLLQVNHDESGGGEAKAINSARAAMAGLFSAVLARRGAKGPRRILEGKDGFLGAFASEVKTELLTCGLGTDFEIRKGYTKFYASGRHSHACIDAALDAFAASELSTEEIAEIRVETYATAIRFTGIVDAANAAAARFSIAYSIAIAITKGGAGPDAFRDEVVADERVRRLAARVRVAESEKWQRLYPDQRGATVTIVGQAGKSWAKEVGLARGEPENPADWADIEAKFRNNATLQVSVAQADRLAEKILHLDEIDLAELTEALR